MSKRQQKPPPSETGAPRARPPLAARENGRLVGLGFLSVVLSVILSVQPLSVLLTAAPAVQPLRRRILAGDSALVTRGLLRWAVTVFLSVLLCAVFVRDRVLDSFPFASSTATAAQRMLDGQAGAPVGWLYLTAGLAGFVILSAATTGIGALLLAAVALGAAAGLTVVVFAQGTNILLMALVALPPWQWAMFAAAVLLFAPAGAEGARFLYKKDTVDRNPERRKHRLYAAAGLFVLALLTRLALAGPWVSLVRTWTVG